MGRGSSTTEQKGFGITDPDVTRDMFDEVVGEFRKMWKPEELLGFPHLAELPHHLVEHVARDIGIRDAEAFLLGGRRPAPHAELEASLLQMVEHRDALRDARRVV